MSAVRESFTKDPFIVPLPDAQHATCIWPAGHLSSFKLTQFKVNSKISGKKTWNFCSRKTVFKFYFLDSPFINI